MARSAASDLVRPPAAPIPVRLVDRRAPAPAGRRQTAPTPRPRSAATRAPRPGSGGGGRGRLRGRRAAAGQRRSTPGQPRPTPRCDTPIRSTVAPGWFRRDTPVRGHAHVAPGRGTADVVHVRRTPAAGLVTGLATALSLLTVSLLAWPSHGTSCRFADGVATVRVDAGTAVRMFVWPESRPHPLGQPVRQLPEGLLRPYGEHRPCGRHRQGSHRPARLPAALPAVRSRQHGRGQGHLRDRVRAPRGVTAFWMTGLGGSERRAGAGVRRRARGERQRRRRRRRQVPRRR